MNHPFQNSFVCELNSGGLQHGQSTSLKVQAVKRRYEPFDDYERFVRLGEDEYSQYRLFRFLGILCRRLTRLGPLVT